MPDARRAANYDRDQSADPQSHRTHTETLPPGLAQAAALFVVMRSAAHVQRAASSALPLVRATVPSVCAHHVPPPRSMATRSDSLPPPFTPARTALIFPGQGAQRVGSVVKTLEAEWPSIVRPVWQELDEALQMHLSRTMKDGLMVGTHRTPARERREQIGGGVGWESI